MCRIGGKPLYTSVGPMLIIKINELPYLYFCFFNITKINLTIVRKLLLDRSVYPLRYRIFQRVAGLCHADLYLLFLQEFYIRMATVLHSPVAVMNQGTGAILSAPDRLF